MMSFSSAVTGVDSDFFAVARLIVIPLQFPVEPVLLKATPKLTEAEEFLLRPLQGKNRPDGKIPYWYAKSKLGYQYGILRRREVSIR